MVVTNSTSSALGFASYVIGAGESQEVDAVAGSWFVRHGCTTNESKRDTDDDDTVPYVPRRRRSKKE